MDTQANMNDQGLIDPDLEPQTRPRSCTWPMQRPNVNVHGQQNTPQDNDMSMKMEATIAECSSQEQLMADDYVAPNAFTMIKEEINAEPYGVMSPSAFPTADFPPGVIGSPTNLVSDLSNILQSPTLTGTSPDGTGGPTNFLSSSLVTSPLKFVATTQNIASSERGPNVTHKLTDVAATTSASVTSSDTTSVTSPSTVATKPKTSSRKNAWGNMSYADLITQGIESSPDKRLTLAQIYDWMVKNVPYFKDKGDSNSSAGWKNSIRHNLSLHSKFKRIQNEGTGKSSWWVINYDAKPGKSPRRRATSMDTSNSKFRRAQSKASSANKKELLKKEKAAMKRDSPTGPTDFEHLNKSLTSDFRQRTSSNASSIGGRISPRQGYLTQDLEDDGPPPLSPLSSSFTPSSAFDLFGGGHDFGLSECLDTNGPTDALQGELLDSIRTGMNLINPSSPLGPGPGNACTTANDRTNIYLNNIGASSQSQIDPACTASSNRTVLSSPNLASLLQQGPGQSNTSSMVMNPASVKSAVGVDLGSSQPRARSNTMPGQLHAQHKYNIPGKMQRLQVSESLSQECLYTPFKETGATLSSSPQNVYRNKVNPYGGYAGGPRNAQQEPSLRMNAQAPAGMSSYSNDRKTLCQLLTQEQTNVKLVTQNQPLLKQTSVGSAHPNQLQASRDRQGPSQISDMQMHDYQSQYKDLLPQAQRVSSKSVMDSMAPISQDIPQGINMDQDFFDPGALDFDLMLRNIDDPVTDDFDWFQPYERTAAGLPGTMEMEQSMDTGNMCDSYKVMGSNDVIFQQQYNPNLVTMNNMNMTQRRQPPPQYNHHQQELYQDNTGFADGNSGMQLDVNSQMNGGALMGGSRVPNNMASLNFAPQYVQPRQTLQPQSSVPSIGHYRM